jgi:hypothetical protein
VDVWAKWGGKTSHDECIERGIGVGILILYLSVLTHRTWHHNACDMIK